MVKVFLFLRKSKGGRSFKMKEKKEDHYYYWPTGEEEEEVQTSRALVRWVSASSTAE